MKKSDEIGGRRGFTLFELLVVIGILVLLVGILIPTLGAVKNHARRTTTLALMSNLQSGIHQYQVDLGDLPGPLPASVTTANTSKVSGAQNLIMGLTYAMATGTAPPPAWGSWTAANPNLSSTGPINYANVQMTGMYEQKGAYFSPPRGGVAVVSGALGSNALPNCPVAMDTFSDPLPILYFRRTPGVTTPLVANYGTSAATPAGFYLAENSEYTRAPSLRSSSGATFNEALDPVGLDVATLTNDINTAGASDYVLISAGIDRYYGTYKGKNDDVVLGH